MDPKDINVKAVRNWFRDLDLSNADLAEVERQINKALMQAWAKKPARPGRIGELADPINLDELVGDHLQMIADECAEAGDRINAIYGGISDTNNTVMAELETTDGLLDAASDALSAVRFEEAFDEKSYYWLGDSFNNSLNVDKSKSTGLVDTDHGFYSLAPSRFQTVNDFDVVLDTTRLANTLPGATLIVTSITNPGNSEKEPSITLESSDTRNIINLNDSDPASWFEVEKNYIFLDQKLSKRGQALFPDQNGKVQNVLEATSRLDWVADAVWPAEAFVGTGNTAQSVSLANFVSTGSMVESSGKDKGIRIIPESMIEPVYLDMVIELKKPTPLSYLNLAPLFREGDSKEEHVVVVERVDVELEGGQWIPVSRDYTIGSREILTIQEKEVLRRTGVSSTGVNFFIPTNRPIVRVRVSMRSPARLLRIGLAHPFKTEKWKIKKTTSIAWGLVSYSSTKTVYIRKPVFDKGVSLVAHKTPKSQGSISAIAEDIYAKGMEIEATGQAIKAGGDAMQKYGVAAMAGTQLMKLGGGLMKAAASTITTVATIGLAIEAIKDVVSGIFSQKTERTLLETITGYDVFAGKRAAIAIRDLTALLAVYDTPSSLVTKRFRFPGPVKRIGIFSEVSIPESWPASPMWATFHYSTDGVNWIKIADNTNSKGGNFVDLEKPAKDIYLKIDLQPNSEDPYHTPIVRHVTIQGEPA